MALPADQLSPGETVVLAVAPESGFLARLDTLGWVAFAGVVLLFGVWPVISWWNRTYTVTNERLATRTGVLRRSGRDIPRIHQVALRLNELVRDSRLAHGG